MSTVSWASRTFGMLILTDLNRFNCMISAIQMTVQILDQSVIMSH